MQRLPLTGLPVTGVTHNVIVCGDPARADRVAARLDVAELLSEQREYRAYRGRYAGVPVTICSHGIGAPGAAVAFEELIVAGARRIVRVGTCGGLQPEVLTGDLVIATAAVDYTGYGRETVPAGYPAVASPRLTGVLQAAIAARGSRCHTGLVLTRDNFYAGVTTPLTPDYRLMSEANVLAVEMECAALFIVGSLRAVQTAAVLAVDGNVLAHGEQIDTYDPQQRPIQQATAVGIEAVLETLAGFPQQDEAK